jgi:transglutaminase-like putative cysteine protease
MYYAVTHLTIYEYSEPITDSVMEVRKQPRSDGEQRCIRFLLEVTPKARVFSYRDYLGNTIHTFNVPAAHEHLALKAEAVVEVKPAPLLPDALPDSAWDVIDGQSDDRDMHDWLLSGQYTRSTELLTQFAQEIDWRRRADPLSMVRELNSAIYNAFNYNQNVTRVDSPIDDALQSRSGVCQDFTHIMLTLTRQLGIPSRYVSGYLAHLSETDRSDTDASHAWVEVWLPTLGWIGFDPTNNLIVSDRHIRVSVARDYAHASPARGVFMGGAETKLGVRVKVSLLDELPVEETPLAPEIVMPQYNYYHQQQQQ